MHLDDNVNIEKRDIEICPAGHYMAMKITFLPNSCPICSREAKWRVVAIQYHPIAYSIENILHILNQLSEL